MGAADVCRTSSQESGRPIDIITGCAILDDAIQDGAVRNDVILDLWWVFDLH